MNTTQQERNQGFTIIEVVLVLAIGALVMLMVFIALPALQRNQRDTQRKNDISRLQSALNNYKSSARGSLPTNAVLQSTGDTGFVARYLTKNNDTFADPSGEVYELTRATSMPDDFSDENVNIIYFNRGGDCGDGQTLSFSTSTTSRKMILIKPLEAGGVHCVSV